MAELPIEELALFAMSAVDAPDNAEVSISFVDDDAIANLNERYRGKAGPTDVLSFECDNADDGWASLSSEHADPAGIYELGDIVIAPDVAERQCPVYGTTFEGEVSLLVVHGLLHLCGYDHVDDDQALAMEAKEREILRQWADRGHEAVRHVRDE